MTILRELAGLDLDVASVPAWPTTAPDTAPQRPTVSTDDSPFDRAFRSLTSDRDLVSSATALVRAVVERHLTLEELRAIEPYSTLSIPENRLEEYERLRLTAEVRLNRFYETFSDRIEHICWHGYYAPHFPHFVKAVQHLFVALPALLRPDEPSPPAHTDQLKVATTIREFNKRILDSLVNTYAQQGIEHLRIDDFDFQADRISRIFPDIEMVDIQMRIRQSIKAHHGTITACSLLGPSADFSAASALLQEVIPLLAAEKEALEVELSAMRGPNGFNGTYNAAIQRVAIADAELDAAAACINLRYSRTAHSVLEEKVAALLQAQQQLAAIQSRFDEIVQYTGTEITGGRLYEINQNLDPVRLEIQAALVEEMISPILAEKAALELELSVLRGPNGFDGTYNAAFEILATAIAEMNAARRDCYVAIGQLVASNPSTYEERLAIFTLLGNSGARNEALWREFRGTLDVVNDIQFLLNRIQSTTCGPNGRAYYAAVERQLNAIIEMNAARRDCYVAIGQLVPANTVTNEEMGALRTLLARSGSLNEAAWDLFRGKRDAANDFQLRLNRIQNKFNEIAQYTGPNLTGGRLFEINQSLDPVRLAAQTTRDADFYQELNRDVTEDNKVVRSEALNRIFG